jgi:hypothetical protein
MIKMSIWKTILGLYLPVALQAQTLSLLSPWDAVPLTAAASEGAAVSLPDMSWAGDYLPQEEWRVSAWVLIKAGTPNSARLMQISTPFGTSFYVTWASDAPPVFTYNSHSRQVTGAISPPYRQENKWISVLFGSNDGTSFGYAVLKKSSDNIFSVSWVETIKLHPADALKCPAHANPFTVSSK